MNFIPNLFMEFSAICGVVFSLVFLAIILLLLSGRKIELFLEAKWFGILEVVLLLLSVAVSLLGIKTYFGF